MTDERQVVLVIHHEAVRAMQSRVCHPVQSPHASTVPQVEVGHRVQGIASTLAVHQVSAAASTQANVWRPVTTTHSYRLQLEESLSVL